METTAAGWTVLDREAGVLALTYTFTKSGTATAFVARMADGTLLVVSPPTRFTDAAAAELAEFGDVGAIVANNGFHHLGQAEWRARYPKARCFAPELAAKRIAKKNPANLPFEPMSALAPLLGDGLGFRDVPNSKCGETWFWARTGDGYAWFLSDVLINMPELPDAFFPRMLFKLSGSAPGYRVFNLAMKFICGDKKGTLRLLLDDVAAYPPTVIVPSHGDLLTQGDIAAETRRVIEAAL